MKTRIAAAFFAVAALATVSCEQHSWKETSQLFKGHEHHEEGDGHGHGDDGHAAGKEEAHGDKAGAHGEETHEAPKAHEEKKAAH